MTRGAEEGPPEGTVSALPEGSPRSPTHPTFLVPSGYPVEYEQFVQLRAGRSVFVRPLLPADRVLLRRAIESADEETLYMRFLTPRPKITAERLRYLTEIDYRHRFALVAFGHEGGGAGIARYEGSPDHDDAEVAVTVSPEWRGLGLATRLLRLIEQAAVERGKRRLHAYYLAENHRAVALLDRCGYRLVATEAGVVECERRLPV